jgi:8-oxo-dGTP diphosphatase
MKDWQRRHKIVPAVYLIFRKDDRILLLQRANTGYMDGMYSLPSGHLDGGEPAVMAAVREAKEEVGVTINPADLRLVHTLHRVAEEGDHERIDLGFEVNKWRGRLRNAEPEKCSGIKWVAADKLPKNMVPLVSYMLQEVAQGKPYSSFNF